MFILDWRILVAIAAAYELLFILTFIFWIGKAASELMPARALYVSKETPIYEKGIREL
jgi:hypothetical protein